MKLALLKQWLFAKCCISAVRDCDEILCNSQGSCRRKIYTEDIYCFCNEGYSGDHCETAPVAKSKLFI